MEFWPLKTLSEVSTFTNSQHGSSLGSVRVHSLTLFALPGACDVTPGSTIRPATLQPPCLGREPKARVTRVLLRMLPFEMAPEVITAVKCAFVAINGARIFAVDGSTDSNSTSGSTDHTGWLMHQSAMSTPLMRSGKTNVTLGALEVGHEYRLTVYRCLGRHKNCNW